MNDLRGCELGLRLGLGRRLRVGNHHRLRGRRLGCRDLRLASGFGLGHRHLALAAVAAAEAADATMVRAGVLRAVNADVGGGLGADAAHECRGFCHWFFPLVDVDLVAGLDGAGGRRIVPRQRCASLSAI